MNKTKLFLCAFISSVFSFLNAPLHAGDLTWTNQAGGNWNVAANWNPNQVPAPGDSVWITNAGTYAVTSSVSSTLATLNIGAGTNGGLQTLQITAGTLTVTNTIGATNSLIHIASGTLLTAGPFNSAGGVHQTGASANWRMLAPGTLNTHNYTNGEFRGATLTVTNFNWAGGNLYADAVGDKTIIAAGGTFNLTGDAGRYLSYYAGGQGRYLDNHGTWNWSGNSILYSYPGVVNNYGTINFMNQGAPASYAQFGNAIATLPTFNNFGTINKTLGTNIVYFGPCNLSNSGNIGFQTGTLALYHGTTTNSGTINIQNGTLLAVNSPVNVGGAINISANSVFQTDSGTVTFYPTSSLSVTETNAFRINGGSVILQTTNVVANSAWIAGGTLFHQANNTIPTINESSGTWSLTGNHFVNTYNFTNGELRGGTLTVTNLNWINGNMNADATGDKTIIPVGGVLNFSGNATRQLSYYTPATRGRDIDNHGTWNWTGDSLLYGVNPAVVNNYGAVNVTGTGHAQFLYYPAYSAPVWNNFGTFTKSVGTNNFYFQGAYVNNSGAVNIGSGTVSIYGSTFTNLATMSLSPSGFFVNENNSVTTLASNSLLSSASGDHVTISSGNMYLQTTNIAAPSLQILGGTLHQQTNIVVPTINQTAGAWRLYVTSAVNTYNFNGGELRGGTLTVTNLNWVNGNMNADANGDKTIIPVGGVLNYPGTATRQLSYYPPATRGRDLDNHGTWNWSGDSLLYGIHPAVVNNYGAVNVTGTGSAQFLYYPGYSAPVWNNYGTFTKSFGTNYFYFQGVYLNNSGAFDIQSGNVSLYGSSSANSGPINVANGILQIFSGVATNSSSITLSSTSILQTDNGATFHLLPATTLVAPTANSVRLNSGTTYLASTNVSSPSIWIAGGTLVQQTNIVVSTINQSAGGLQLAVPAALESYNMTNGLLRGRTLTVTNFNWIAGNLYADANGDKTIIPVGGVLNMNGNTTRYLTYDLAATAGRGIDNHGTWNWTGDCLLIGLHTGATVNNFGAVNVTGTGTSQFTYNVGYTGPTWNNFGTFTKSVGTNYFYFTACYLNNTNMIDVQSGTLSLHAGISTNKSTGKILLAENSVLLNENNNTAAFETGSTLAGASPNSFRLLSGTVYLRSTGISIPSISLVGGTLWQEVNNVVPELNQSGGAWRLAVPTGIGNYNMSGGELRGADIAINNFNWTGGQLNSDGAGSNLVTVASAFNISGGAAKGLSYYALPGRSIINNGTGTWGGASITGQGGATIRNNGSLNVTNDVGLAWGGSGPVSVFHNIGTYTKSAGNGTAAFSSTTITNSGTFNVNSGGIQIGGAFVQTAGNAHLGTNFTASSALRVEAGTLTGRGSVAGAFYNNGVVNPGASPGLITGANYTNSATGILNIELGGLVAGISHDQIQLSGAATLNGTMNVTLANNFAPQLSNSFTVMRFGSRAGTFPTITPPPGVVLDAVYSNTNLVLTVVGLTNAPLEITSYPSNQTIWTPDPVTFGVGVSGVTPITYQWQHDGTNILNATNSVFNIPAVATTNAGLYNVLVTDANGGATNASATLTVIPFVGTMNWTNTAGGNWNVASNWEPNRVPSATNTAIISIPGTYTVNVNSSESVSNLFVGATNVAGKPTLHIVAGHTLALKGDATIETNGIVALNGLLQTANSLIDMRGRIDWFTGTLSGSGNTVIATNAIVHFLGSQQQKHIVTNILENYGDWTTSPDAGIGPGQLPRFSGGAQLTNHVGGTIHMGANGLTYAGAQTPRSYLVNFGRIVASTTSVFSPSQIGIDFINYGVLQNNSYVYIGRGTNYGTMQAINGLAEISIFGDATSGEYFSFEPGTTFDSPQVNIVAAGPVQWRAGNTIHTGALGISAASGGATTASAEFKILANYTNTFSVGIARGALTIPGANTITDLNSFSDAFVSFWSFGITNAGTMYVNSLSRSLYGFGNGGSVIVRSNATFSGGSLHGNGQLLINTGANVTLSGGNFDTHYIENLGNITVSGGATMTGNSVLHNAPNSTMYLAGGSLGGGPASVINESSISGFGGIGISTTNYANILIDDPLNRVLTLSSLVQETGTTQIARGRAGGNFDIRGGQILATNQLNGTLRNAATLIPGTPLGLLAISGNYTNDVLGTQKMAIQGTGAISNHTQVQVGGTAHLAGALNVEFINDFHPAPGNLFTAMVFSARSGTFDSIVNPTYQLEAFYTSTTLVLRAENLLPIPAINVLGGNTQLVCNPFQVTATASDPDGIVTNISLFMNGVLIGSSAGSSITMTIEKDFPSMNTFSAEATDNRNGKRSIEQDVELTTLPLHVLTLGGFRGNDFKICMLGEQGANYMTLANTNLNTTNWVEIGPMIFTNGIWRYFDTNGNNGGQKYYKAARQE